MSTTVKITVTENQILGHLKHDSTISITRNSRAEALSVAMRTLTNTYNGELSSYWKAIQDQVQLIEDAHELIKQHPSRNVVVVTGEQSSREEGTDNA